MIAFIVQARLSSTRLPNKVNKKIYGKKTVLDICIENLRFFKHKIIIATTNNPKDKKIVEIAERNKVAYFRGSEENVLKRYIDCAEEFHISQIIRITSDNIFIQPNLLRRLINSINPELDYISYRMKSGINVVLTHWGLFSEYVSLNALKKIIDLDPSEKAREHVTYYIYNHQEEFNIKYLPVPKELNRNDIRLTIDNLEDYNICKQIYIYLKKHGLEPNFHNIINYLEQNTSLMNKMKINIEKIHNKNMKKSNENSN